LRDAEIKELKNMRKSAAVHVMSKVRVQEVGLRWLFFCPVLHKRY